MSGTFSSLNAEKRKNLFFEIKCVTINTFFKCILPARAVCGGRQTVLCGGKNGGRFFFYN